MVYFDSEAKETRMLRVFGQDVMDGTNWEIIERRKLELGTERNNPYV